MTENRPDDPGTEPGGPTAVRCPSTFDRWRCDHATGHAGEHEAVAADSRTTWSTGLSGRRLRDLSSDGRGTRTGPFLARS